MSDPHHDSKHDSKHDPRHEAKSDPDGADPREEEIGATDEAQQGQDMTGEEETPLVGTDEYTIDLGGGADRMAELEAEIAELKDKLLRAAAEAENIRRRSERERADTAKYAVSKFAADVLNVADNLHRAMGAVDPDARARDSFLDTLMGGIEATERELAQIFTRHGIVRIEAMGQPFDPNRHEALFEQPSTEHPPGTVVQVIQDGYMIAERLLRPARVGVAKAADGQPGGTSPGSHHDSAA